MIRAIRKPRKLVFSSTSASALRIAVLLVLALARELAAADADPPWLELGATITGTLGAADPTTATPRLERIFGDRPVRTKRYRLRVPDHQPCRVELRSYSFDAYLVLRDQDGKVLLEDDHGLPFEHAQVVIDAQPVGTTLLVEACALPDGSGPFEITLRSGAPSPVPGADQWKVAVNDATRRVAMLREQRGDEDAGTIAWQLRLGRLVQDSGDYEQAGRVLERVLQVREKTLGREHLDTLQAMNILGVIRMQQGRYPEARKIQQEVLDTAERTLGEEHPLIAISVSNLG
jgi:hypothetical protein